MKGALLREAIESKIFVIRGCKVMVDRDLAELYGVQTKRLNEQVRRNIERFPEDFMFQLNDSETRQLVAFCDRFGSLKHSSVHPYVFTEQGVAMLSSVLHSKKAIQVNVAVMRVFVKLREMIATHKELMYKLGDLERKIGRHDEQIRSIFEAIRQLMAVPERPKRRIGFHSQ
jgi:hypothetical protein